MTALMPNSDKTAQQPAPAWLKIILGWLFIIMGWGVCVFCVVVMLIGLMSITSGETNVFAGSVLIMLLLMAAYTAWCIQRFGQKCKQTASSSATLPDAISMPDGEHRQPAPRFIWVVIWALLSVLLFIVLLFLLGFVMLAIHQQREMGLIVFMLSWTLFNAGCLFAAVKKCTRVYQAYDAAQRQW